LQGALEREGLHFHLMFNAFWEPLEFELPGLDGKSWRRWIDTALDSPDDICNWEQSTRWVDPTYCVADRSVVMLVTV
jgi:isoamylase